MQKLTNEAIDNLVDKAISMANSWHKGQMRKSNHLPYICHPLEVLKELANRGFDKYQHTNVWIAAILHDLLEDTNVPADDIAAVFGVEVLNLVKELTYKKDEMPKEQYIESFANKSVESLAIKMMDRVCNINDFYNQGDVIYAKKYYNKGKVLFDIWFHRKEEIVAKFGENIWRDVLRVTGMMKSSMNDFPKNELNYK